MGRSAGKKLLRNKSIIQARSVSARETIQRAKPMLDLLRQDIIDANDCPESRQVMVDFENTIFPYHTALAIVHKTNPDLSEDQARDYIYSNPSVMNSVGVYKGAQVIISSFQKNKLGVHIVSSVSQKYQSTIKQFLASQNITYSKLVLGSGDKLAYCQQEKISTLIDDNPDLIENAEKEGIDAVSFVWDHNADSLSLWGGDGARSWKEIGVHVLDATERHIKKERTRRDHSPGTEKRLERDKNMIEEASRVGNSGTCLRRRVGATIITDDGKVIATGSNQSPGESPSCEEDGCLTDHQGRCQRTVHAESQAILSAPAGSLKGSTLYCTDRPCLGCAKLIAEAGIKRVVYARPYHAEAFEVEMIFESCGVEVEEIAYDVHEIEMPFSGPREGQVAPDNQPIKATD